MGKSANIISIIPARGGSKGVPRKNIRILGGKPLIAHTINTAKESNLIERVFVTTDDEEIASVARQYGAEVPFLRPRELAEDNTPPDLVLAHCLEYLETQEDIIPEIIVWLEPPTPFRTVQEVDDAIKLFQSDPEADTLRAVCSPRQNPFKMWTLNGKYLKPLITENGVVFHSGPRQKIKSVYWQNGSIFLLRYSAFKKYGNFYGEKVLPFFVEAEKSIDIDTEADLEFAEYFFNKHI